jgi:competence protein ComEC
LLRNPDALAADVFKVPHHGSRDQLPALATAVAPRVALVSVGANNDYGHPAPSTLSTLTGLGAVVARTDTDGDIAVVGPADRLTVVRRGAADSRIGAG